jgi:ribosome-interacting GTPase 1
MTDPIILEKGSTLEAAAAAVHKDFASKLKYARIWGSGKFDGIMVKRDHVLQDGDIIELHL